MDSLVRDQPFVDGNKRTAIAAAGIFLAINEHRLVVENAEMVRFTLACAQSQLSLPEITVWFQRHSTPNSE
jgi:death-on-curing protein